MRTRRLIVVVAAALSLCTIASGDDFGNFLLSIEDARILQGTDGVLPLVETRLAEGRERGADLGRLRLLHAGLLLEKGRADEAIREWTEGVILSEDATPGQKATAAEAAFAAYPREKIRQRMALLDEALAQPGLSRGEPAARLWTLRGKLGEMTGYGDLSSAAFVKAAELHEAPEKKAEALLDAAGARLLLRDLDGARRLYKEVWEIAGVDKETASRARLRHAITYLTGDQYGWTLTPERYKEAAALIKRHAPVSSSQAVAMDFLGAQEAIFRAALALGDHEEVSRIGGEILGDPRSAGDDFKSIRLLVLLVTGDIAREDGRLRDALRLYERALPLSRGACHVYERIAVTAEALKDYVKAMDCYGHCVRLTDSVRQPALFRQYVDNTKRLSAYLRKNAPKPTAEEIFKDDFDAGGGISLDE